MFVRCSVSALPWFIQNLLAGVHGAHQRDPADRCAGSMGASYDQQGSRPNGAGPEGAQPAGVAGHLQVVAVDLPGGAGPDEHGAGVPGGGRARRQGGAVETKAPASRAPPASAVRGIGGSIHRGLTPAYLYTCKAELGKSILRGALTGAIWTAVGTNERGLRPTRVCPYCDKQEPEDEEHLLWRCTTWKAKREPLIAEIMLLAKALKLGSLREWPPCVRLCGIIPDSVVLTSGIGEGERWRKRCMDLGRVPRHWLQRPLEDVEDRLREVDTLAEAGAAWAAYDTHLWQRFAMKLHEMFLGVLRDRKGADDEAGSLFPTSHRKKPHNT